MTGIQLPPPSYMDTPPPWDATMTERLEWIVRVRSGPADPQLELALAISRLVDLLSVREKGA